MKQRIKQFVPSEACLACQGCCRFHEEDSFWRPRVVPTEIPSGKDWPMDKDCLRTRPHEGIFICSFLVSKDNTCEVYAERPFECRLYPFIISSNAAGTALFAHLSCPYLQEKYGTDEFKEYKDYLFQYKIILLIS